MSVREKLQIQFDYIYFQLFYFRRNHSVRSEATNVIVSKAIDFCHWPGFEK